VVTRAKELEQCGAVDLIGLRDAGAHRARVSGTSPPAYGTSPPAYGTMVGMSSASDRPARPAAGSTTSSRVPQGSGAHHERAIGLFASLVGVTALGVLTLAVLAGGFVNQKGRHSWITAHSVVADVVVLIALLTAGVAVTQLRRSHPALTTGAVALLLLLIVQTAIGQAIKHARDLTLIHVPLAMAIFGATVYLSLAAANARRGMAR